MERCGFESRWRRKLPLPSAVGKAKCSNRKFPLQMMQFQRHRQKCRCYCEAGMAQYRDTSRIGAGMSPRSPEQLFLPAEFGRRETWTSDRFAPGLAVRTNVFGCRLHRGSASEGGPYRDCSRGFSPRERWSWTWCRAGLLRLSRGRMWVRIPPGPFSCYGGPVAQR
jgi:hypothetical protein